MTNGRPAARLHYGYVVLTLIVVAVFGSLGLGRHGYASVLPAMQDSLRLTNTQTGELQSWNLLGYLLTVVFAGFLAARFGPRVVISISLLVTAAALTLTGLIPTFGGAQLGRFLAGVGGAGGNVPAMALVCAWFGVRRRGLAAGAAVSGSSFGLMVTGPLIPVLLSQHGAEAWRVCWYVLGALALAAFIPCALFLRNRPDEYGLAPVGASGAEIGGHAPGQRTPSLQWSLVYRSRLLWHLAIVYFAFGFSYVIYSTFFIRYLVKEAGFSKASAGSLWLQIGMVSVISGFIWGSISDRWGRRLALLGVFTLQAVAFLSFGLNRSLPGIYFSAGLFAITAWSIPALMAALAGDLFGGRLAPAALGLMTIIFGIGQALGPYLAGRIADSTHSFSAAFITAGLVALFVGAGGSLLLHPKVAKTGAAKS
jgi:MFS family permease